MGDHSVTWVAGSQTTVCWAGLSKSQLVCQATMVVENTAANGCGLGWSVRTQQV